MFLVRVRYADDSKLRPIRTTSRAASVKRSDVASAAKAMIGSRGVPYIDGEHSLDEAAAGFVAALSKPKPQ
jgi:hypothetical protein